MARLEHVNFYAGDPDGLAAVMVALFDWRIRWAGAGNDGRRVVHVGSAEFYLSIVAANGAEIAARPDRLRHIGIAVDDLDKAENRVLAAGFGTFDHADYAPGRRFYFTGPDGLEFEVVSYASQADSPKPMESLGFPGV